MSLRSLLFAPGDSARKVERSLASKAGTAVLDLEDAVLPSAKLAARSLVQEALSSNRAIAIAVRVNAQDTEWYRDDILAIAPLAPDYIMLPKCRCAADLIRLDVELSLIERMHNLPAGRIGILPLVTEDARSLGGLDYRQAPKRTAALCVAAEDLASDLGISSRSDSGEFASPIAHARIATKIAAAAAGLPAIDTPFPDPHQSDQLRIEAQDALRSGFAGKLCIHPAQIEIVEDVFRPAPEKLRWADAVIAAFAGDAASGATLIDGRMVDRAHLRLAHELRANST